MSQETATVLLVPSLHPRGAGCSDMYTIQQYHCVAERWFNVIVHQVGWNDRMPLAEGWRRLSRFMDDMIRAFGQNEASVREFESVELPVSEHGKTI